MPKVSVSLITYNHEKFIAACLDSIVAQITAFDFEIVVCDDASTDKTPEIISGYAAKYPQLIKPILRKNNLGMVKNALAAIEACSGQYIAIMEGDDFWTDDNKLQMQASYLDKNTDCVLCYTNGYTFYMDEPGKKDFFFTDANKPTEKIDLDFFIHNGALIPNNTKMFRKEIQPATFPDWIYSALNWDWVLHILQLRLGMAGYIDAPTLAYRRHQDAAFGKKSEEEILLGGIETGAGVNKLLNYRYNEHFKNMWWEYRELGLIYLRKRSLVNFLNYYLRFITSGPKSGKLSIKDELWRIKTALFGRKA